jgi:hypothetical protein
MTLETVQESRSATQHPLLSLTEEELDLVLQLVLASGSLKDLAHAYQVSYPTIRSKVDRLIERVQQIVGGTTPDPMMQLLANLVERGEITVSAARAVRDLYRQQKAEQKENI